MNRNILYLALAALLFAGCAKVHKTGLNDSDKQYLDAWVKVNHPGASQTALGSYILQDTPGNGLPGGTANENPFVRVEYVMRNLSGSVEMASDEQWAKRLGYYDPNTYYGPVIWGRGYGQMAPGMDEILQDMREGGSRTSVVPGWLQSTYKYYKTAQEYLDNVTGTPYIYEVKLRDVISDIRRWETDSLARYVHENYTQIAPWDSLKYGFYYVRTGAPSRNIEMPADTTIYLNYVLRLLNGKVVDTNVRDTAAFYGIYSSARTYGPTAITWYGQTGTYRDIKFGSSSDTIEGFLYAVSLMHPHEKGTALFYSGLGYSYRSISKSIPAYSPLRFDLEVVDKP